MAGLKRVLLATRPWSFPFTVAISIIAGLTGFFYPGNISWPLLAIAVAGSVLLHAMVNLLNDYFDYKMNIDRPGVGTVEYRPHPIVHGILSPSGTFFLGSGVGIVGLLMALLLSITVRPLAFWLGLAGFILAFAYTGPPFSLKYRAMGEIAVYAAWGFLIPLGSYYLATGELSLLPVIVSVPLALFVVAILLANNLRDIEADKGAGIKTLATLLDYEKTRSLFKALIVAAYLAGFASLLSNIYLLLPPLLGLASIRDAGKVFSMFDGGEAPADADPRVAGLMGKYVFFYMIGLLMAVLLYSFY